MNSFGIFQNSFLVYLKNLFLNSPGIPLSELSKNSLPSFPKSSSEILKKFPLKLFNYFLLVFALKLFIILFPKFYSVYFKNFHLVSSRKYFESFPKNSLRNYSKISLTALQESFKKIFKIYLVIFQNVFFFNSSRILSESLQGFF